MKKITIVSSCYNEELNIQELYERVKAQMDKYEGKYEWDYILADNGSTDNTAQKLKELASRDKRIKVIINSRNFGHIRSPYYVIVNADADAVISICSDLQDPPELLPQLIEKWEQGNEIVLLQKNRSKENAVMFALRNFYYYVMSKMADNGVDLARGCTGSGLIDRKILEVLKQNDDPYPYYRGLLCEMGFKRDYVQFEQPLRKNGRSGNNFYTLYDMGMTGLVKFSKFPLRFMTFIGFIMSMVMFVLTVFYLVYKLLYWDSFSVGVAPMVIGALFLGSIQLFCLGIIGEYIGAIYTRIDKKPLVIEKERINF